jgi:phospholipid transport system substrate-binding protein
MTLRKTIPLLLLLTLLVSALPAVAAPLSATEELKVNLDAIVALLADKEMDKKARRTQVVEKIRAKFDFNNMGRFILGRKWKKTSEEDRARFVKVFSHILEETYIGRLEAYTDEEVRYVGERLKGGKAKVETMVISSSTEIPIDYKLWQDGGEWKVYDVSIEGVSLVRNFQDSYKKILRKEGIDGLIKKMTKKLGEMKAKSK